MIERPRTQAEFRRFVHETILDAQTLYKIDFGRVTITFDLRGERAAVAYQVPHETRGFTYKLRFNKEAIRLDWDHMVASTIPHEVAHLVAFALPKLNAEHHNEQWRKIAIRLGDITRGDVYHHLPLKPARRLTKFVYQNETGARAEVSLRLHRQVQDGVCAISCNHHLFDAEHFVEVTIGGTPIRA